MAIYGFSFDDKYAGHTAAITNVGGTPFAATVTLDEAGDATLNATVGSYRARVDNSADGFGDGFSVVDGVLDIPGSLGTGAAAGLSTDNEEHYIETGDPVTVSPGTFYIPWADGDIPILPDSPDWFDLSDVEGQADVGHAGACAVWFYVTFTDPAQVTYVECGSGHGRAASGSAVLQPGFGEQTVYGSGVMRLDAELQQGIRVVMNTGSAPSPVLPDISYAYLALKKLIDSP